MSKKHIIIIVILVVIAGVGALVFYFLPFFHNTPSDTTSVGQAKGKSFIESTAQAPAVEGNIINSGIAGNVVLTNGKPFEASLEVFLAQDMSKPFISVRTHSDGTFQIPLKPGNYVLKPADPDGPIAPVKESYNFTIGGGQWLQTKIEYK